MAASSWSPTPPLTPFTHPSSPPIPHLQHPPRGPLLLLRPPHAGRIFLPIRRQLPVGAGGGAGGGGAERFTAGDHRACRDCGDGGQGPVVSGGKGVGEHGS
eukprot:scaffold6527_cov48-Isochrysis_galbana.AAC.1